jgi:hypothetical protein
MELLTSEDSGIGILAYEFRCVIGFSNDGLRPALRAPKSDPAIGNGHHIFIPHFVPVCALYLPMQGMSGGL